MITLKLTFINHWLTKYGTLYISDLHVISFDTSSEKRLVKAAQEADKSLSEK